MFSVYGISGPIFRGPLESMDRVNPVARASAVSPVAPIGAEQAAASVGAVTAYPLQEAIQAYRQKLPQDLERGPLYHAAQVMSQPAITVLASDSVTRAWHTLRDHHIHQAPVLDDNRHLVGIVSERDLLTVIDVDGDRVIEVLRRQVRDVMTTPVVAAAEITDIRRIARLMLEDGVDGVPIVNEAGKMVGFVSRSDVLRAVITDPPLSLWR